MGAALREVRADRGRRALACYLLAWTLLPGFVLSFSSAKSRGYLLPSYAGAAVLMALWIEAKLRARGTEGWPGFGWLAAAAPFAVFSVAFSELEVRRFLAIAAIGLVPLAGAATILLAQRRLPQALAAAIAALLACLILWRSPNVTYALRRDREFSNLAAEVWARAGEQPVYLFAPTDPLRGAIPFSAKRPVYEAASSTELAELLRRPGRAWVVMDRGAWKKRSEWETFAGILHAGGDPRLAAAPRWVMLSNLPLGTTRTARAGELPASEVR